MAESYLSLSWKWDSNSAEARQKIFAKRMSVGIGVQIDGDTTIGTPEHPLEEVVLGDHVYIGSGCNISTLSLTIGDYTKIHRNSLVYGRTALSIGHNCWFGEGTIIDAEGQTAIGNNVGVGAHSQLWSHIRHGDLLMGCTLYGFGNLVIEDDAWLVGHCIVSPVRVASFSVALVGSVVTTDTKSNRVYGGSPAKDLTEKLGAPYHFPPMPDRVRAFESRLQRFLEEHPEAVGTLDFDPTTRRYRKTRSVYEALFMKSLLPECKFLPDA